MQSQNAESRISVTVSGIATVLKAVQANAREWIMVTPLGIVMEVNRPQLSNIPCLISERPSERVTEFRLSQYENALLPISLTLLGRFTDMRDLHAENAEVPIFSTLSEMVREARFLNQ
nr:hypothetical protein [Neglectibacter sp. M00184]